MRKILSLLIVSVLLNLFLISCDKVDDGSYVTPISLQEKVKGKWILTDVVQIDETAKISGIKPDEINLFNEFGFSSMGLDLDVDGNNSSTTFAVKGDAPSLFATSGYWDINPSFQPASGEAPLLKLYKDQSKQELLDVIQIVSVPGAKETLELKITRYSSKTPFVSYYYTLMPVE